MTNCLGGLSTAMNGAGSSCIVTGRPNRCDHVFPGVAIHDDGNIGAHVQVRDSAPGVVFGEGKLLEIAIRLGDGAGEGRPAFPMRQVRIGHIHPCLTSLRS